MYYVGYNKMWCKGACILGPKPHAVMITFLLINIPISLFWGFTTEFYWKRNVEWKIALMALVYF